MFEPTIKYDVELVKGINNMFFGGNGMFFVTLDGPGKVWLQGMPVSKLGYEILKHVRK